MQSDLHGLAARSFVSRFLYRANVSAKFDEHHETLEDASRSFQVCHYFVDARSRRMHDQPPQIASLIALSQTASEQAEYGMHQVRLIIFVTMSVFILVVATAVPLV